MAFRLAAEATAAGFSLRACETIDSTSAEALRLGRGGASEPLWVVSSLQTQGRGRRGSAWDTPRGNLAASLLRTVTVEPARLATLGFVAGLALDAALRDCCGGEGDASRRFALKWPNDVLADGAKLAGILLETETAPSGARLVVTGIGVNVVGAPQGLPYPASCLSALGCPASAETLFEALSAAWVAFERLWDEGRGFAEVRRLWLDRAAGLGLPTAVRLNDAVLRGTFETIDEAGQLVLRTDAGDRHWIAAGDVHFGVAASAR